MKYLAAFIAAWTFLTVGTISALYAGAAFIRYELFNPFLNHDYRVGMVCIAGFWLVLLFMALSDLTSVSHDPYDY